MKKKKDSQLSFSVIPDGEQGTVLSTTLDLSTLEAHLWEAANILRGPVDAADFKTYIFPLLFFKRISDVYEEQSQGKAALTELFNEVRTTNTSVMVERIVNDIDQIVRIVRFPGWQQTIAGDREVKQALRKTLLKYKLHQEQDLFDRAYEYIKQYY
ncbi:MAG TPA: type I restriction-modification system subunit M N-terminal domain-containing protein [Ktedonobacteraceae bacterium]|nr:type I restriction-modification system subunit M N-terminal domain-containing protein [Ktedonobacteraceae bacterium]